MKLSEILKDWPEKKDFKGYPDVGDTNEAYIFYEDKGHNAALKSCDREIDREALEDILCHHAPMLRSEANDISHAIISNMPTWLKRSEDK